MQTSVGLASVATGFPTGQFPLESRVLEVRRVVEAGASEIDIVLDRALVLAGHWRGVCPYSYSSLTDSDSHVLYSVHVQNTTACVLATSQVIR